MISRTHRNLLAAWAIGLCAVALPGTVSAQTTPDPAATTTQRTDVDDDGGRDWGWIGLIGLAGLLGMRRREPERVHVHDRTADRATTGSTTGRV